MEFTLGSHIQTPRTGYTHHGIYIGNEEVIHYSGWATVGQKGIVEKTSLIAFSDGRPLSLYKASGYLKGEQLPVEEIIARAYKALGEDSYNLLFNNCEHFANWCTHDDHFSSQTSGNIEKNIRSGLKYIVGGLDPFDLVAFFKPRRR
jgi:hypothetical protein